MLCDPNGGQWFLDNLTPQAGGCTPNMQAVSNTAGYSFGTLSSFPHGVPLSAANTVTISGQISNNYSMLCLGAAEGNATIGYVGLLCDDGQWYINSVVGLGTTGAVVGRQLATGSYPYNSSTVYDISLTFGSGAGKFGVTFTQGSASPISQTFSTGQFTPDVVGYALHSSGGQLGEAVAGFTYQVG